MTESMERWLEDGLQNNWQMPRAAWWKRLPGVRHVRAVWHVGRVAQYQAYYRSMGLLPTGYDEWVLWGIAHGMERGRGEDS
jgi:hypothetical protein